MGKDDALVDAVATHLVVNGHAQLRTGKRRTTAAARKVAKAAAEQAGVEVKTSDKGDHLEITVK